MDKTTLPTTPAPKPPDLTTFSTLKSLFGLTEMIAPGVAQVLAQRGQLLTAGRDGRELLCTREHFVAAMSEYFERVPEADAAHRARAQQARFWDQQRAFHAAHSKSVQDQQCYTGLERDK